MCTTCVRIWVFLGTGGTAHIERRPGCLPDYLGLPLSGARLIDRGRLTPRVDRSV